MLNRHRKSIDYGGDKLQTTAFILVLFVLKQMILFFFFCLRVYIYCLVWTARKTNMPRGRKVIEVQRREKSFRFYTYACRRRTWCVYNISQAHTTSKSDQHYGRRSIVGFSVKQGVKTGRNQCDLQGRRVGRTHVSGVFRVINFQSFLVRAVGGPCSGGIRELLLQAMTTTTTAAAVAVAELTARFIGRLMTLIPGAEWQPPES